MDTYYVWNPASAGRPQDPAGRFEQVQNVSFPGGPVTDRAARFVRSLVEADDPRVRDLDEVRVLVGYHADNAPPVRLADITVTVQRVQYVAELHE